MINATLKSISRLLGLSISTVSRALKNHPDISENTKLRVMELASTMDYEPNINAINLRTNTTRLFGLVVPSISNFFYDSFISAVEEECRKNNYALMILQSGDDPAIEITSLKLCRQNRISGLFACVSSKTNQQEHFLKWNELKIPTIFFDKVPDLKDCTKVCVADAEAASMAADAIIKKKKKKVMALFGDKRLLITQKRQAAFTSLMLAKAPGTKLLLGYAVSSPEAEQLASKYLQEKPDTVFCMSDEILTGVMIAIQKKGLKIPNAISVIAISNGFIPKLYYPAITYIETSGYKLGKLAFSNMMAHLNEDSEGQELTAEAILVAGGSL
jgi:LacI family transcriptional regulator